MTADTRVCGKSCPCPDLRLADMQLLPSDDGHHLLVCCRHGIVAILSGTGGDVEVFELADVGRLTAMELIERL